MGSVLVIEDYWKDHDGKRVEAERSAFGRDAFLVRVPTAGLTDASLLVRGERLIVQLQCDACGWTHVGAQWRPEQRACLCGDCVRDTAASERRAARINGWARERLQGVQLDTYGPLDGARDPE